MGFFKNMKKATKLTAKHSVDLYGDECLADAIDGAIQICREPDAPRYVGFANYVGEQKHDKECIASSSAIVLEWNAIVAPQVIDTLADTMWAHLLVDTENETSNRIAAIIPLAEPITDWKNYTRVASLLSKFLGVYHLSEGCWNNTFLIKFQPFANSVFVNGTVLDAEKFTAKFTGEWAEAIDYVGPEPIKKIATPTFAKGVGKEAAKVQLDMPPGADDLFSGL